MFSDIIYLLIILFALRFSPCKNPYPLYKAIESQKDNEFSWHLSSLFACLWWTISVINSILISLLLLPSVKLQSSAHSQADLPSVSSQSQWEIWPQQAIQVCFNCPNHWNGWITALLSKTIHPASTRLAVPTRGGHAVSLRSKTLVIMQNCSLSRNRSWWMDNAIGV